MKRSNNAVGIIIGQGFKLWDIQMPIGKNEVMSSGHKTKERPEVMIGSFFVLLLKCC